jgi:hypothetical protein
VTPNPHNLSMQLHEFWTDLQHVRFYNPEIVRWVAHEAGLREIETGENDRYLSDPRVANYIGVFDRPSTPRTLRSRLKQRVTELFTPPWVFQMREIVRGLYPPAEFYVTGVR